MHSLEALANAQAPRERCLTCGKKVSNAYAYIGKRRICGRTRCRRAVAVIAAAGFTEQQLLTMYKEGVSKAVFD